MPVLPATLPLVTAYVAIPLIGQHEGCPYTGGDGSLIPGPHWQCLCECLPSRAARTATTQGDLLQEEERDQADEHDDRAHDENIVDALRQACLHRLKDGIQGCYALWSLCLGCLIELREGVG